MIENFKILKFSRVIRGSLIIFCKNHNLLMYSKFVIILHFVVVNEGFFSSLSKLFNLKNEFSNIKELPSRNNLFNFNKKNF